MTTTQPLTPINPVPAGSTLAATPTQAPDTAATLPPTLPVTQKRALPSGLGRRNKQLAVLVRDRSGSMSGPKLAELNQACIAFQREVADPINEDGILISVIDFNHGAELRCSAQIASMMTMPEAICSGGTNFDAPLKAALAEVEGFMTGPNPEGWTLLRPQVLFLSDGHAGVTDRNIQALHEVATVTAVAYGADADRATLERISSDGQVHVIGTSGDQLRQFFAEVGKTMTSAFNAAP